MNDQKGNDSKSDIHLFDSEKTNKKKKSLVDSLFVSNGIIIAMGIIVIFTIFIMSSYIFTLHKREVEIAIKQSWIDASATIIMTAQEQYERLTALRDTIPRIEATKRSLLLEETNIQQNLNRMQNQLIETQAQRDQHNAALGALRSEIATAENRTITLRNDLPRLEQAVQNLEVRRSSLQDDVDRRGSELSELDGRITAARTQLSEITTRLQSITSVESDFTQVQTLLSDVASQLNSLQSQFRTTNSNLESQVTNLTEQNSRISEEANNISTAGQALNGASLSIVSSSQQLNNELTNLHTTNDDLKSATEVMAGLSRQLRRSEASIASLTETVNSAKKNLERLEQETKSSQNAIDTKSKKLLSNIIETTESLSVILTNLPKIQEQLNKLQSQVNQSESP